MATRKQAKKTGRKAAKKKVVYPPDHFVPVSNPLYGKKLQGIKVHYEGNKPVGLKADGSISFGKNILELLIRTFGKFDWILTSDVDSVEYKYGKHKVRTSVKTISKMYQESFARSKGVKEDILTDFFSIQYPGQFTAKPAVVYAPGTISKIVGTNIISRLSKDDKEALNKFIPDFIATESYGSVNILKASAQIKTLKEIAKELQNEMGNNRSEGWWQQYIKANILIIQQGYIKAIDKMNVALGNTKYPDFSLITHDSYLDVLEIKKPNTELMKHDTSRNNYYWDSEISRAIVQTENYLHNINAFASDVRSYILDNYKIDLKVVRPRGIILAGNTSNFQNQKQKDDFRLLTQANKNIIFLTYDELSNRLENYISVLEAYSIAPTKKKNSVAVKKSAKSKAP